MVDKLVEECTENIKEIKLIVTLAKHEHKCTLYIELFWIFFIFSVINIGIGIYFVYYYWYLKKKKNSYYV